MHNESKIFELAIIGGGPAGSAAAVYAGRKKIDTIVIKKEWGGQSVVSPDIHNWIGTKSISGQKLGNDLKDHVLNYQSDLLKVENEEVEDLVKENNLFKISAKSGKTFLAKTVLITTGSNRKTLEVPGAARLEHRGVTYCASCDGLFFANMNVAVVGAGNSAFESALQLLAYCPSVTILVRGENIRADPLTTEAVKKNPNAKIIFNTEIVEVLGEKNVSCIKVKNSKTGDIQDINVNGVFVEIGQIPNTKFVENIATIDKNGKIEIDPWTQKTSHKGIWAAGDCTNIKYHQNNIAAGDGVKALEDIYQYLRSEVE